MSKPISPVVVKLIENYIDDIDKQSFFRLLVSCPIDYIEECVDVLNDIECILSTSEYQYVCLARVLAKTTKACTCIVANYQDSEAQYSFEFPIRLFNVVEVQSMLRNCAPSCRIYIKDLTSSITTGMSQLDITVVPC